MMYRRTLIPLMSVLFLLGAILSMAYLITARRQKEAPPPYTIEALPHLGATRVTQIVPMPEVGMVSIAVSSSQGDMHCLARDVDSLQIGDVVHLASVNAPNGPFSSALFLMPLAPIK